MKRTLAFALFAAGAVLATAYFASALAMADVSVVRVEGQLSAAQGEQVRQAVATEMAKPGLRTAADVATAVRDLGWVREVRVRRHWPDALHLAVTRETVAACWGDDAWLTTSGNVVSAANANARCAGNLPTLRTTLAAAPRAMQVFNSLNESAAALDLRVSALQEDVGGEWRVRFDNDLEVVLGATNLSARFNRFAAVYRSVLKHAETPFETVDARYDTGVAVRWPDAYTTAAWSNDG